MLQKTHTLAGVVAAECVIIHFNQPLISWEAGTALLIGCIVGPLADIDKKGSTMAQILLPLSWVLQLLRVKHRTLTHSLLFLVLLGYLLAPLPEFFYWTILAAYASHPLIDLLNDQGVALLWPINKKFRLLPKPIGIDTGSFQEIVFRIILAVVAIILPFISLGSF